jgi:hypothetical protein
MPHDATRVLLGTTPWSAKDVSNFPSDPAEFPPAIAVRLDDEGHLSTAKDAGRFAGISLGRSVQDPDRTAVLRNGSLVPLRLTDGFAPTIGAQVWIDDETGYGNIPDDGGVSTSLTSANYVSGQLIGVTKEGDEFPVALVDLPGGL